MVSRKKKKQNIAWNLLTKLALTVMKSEQVNKPCFLFEQVERILAKTQSGPIQKSIG